MKYNKYDLLAMSLQLQPYERKQMAAWLVTSLLGDDAAKEVTDNVCFGRNIINHKED